MNQLPGSGSGNPDSACGYSGCSKEQDNENKCGNPFACASSAVNSFLEDRGWTPDDLWDDINAPDLAPLFVEVDLPVKVAAEASKGAEELSGFAGKLLESPMMHDHHLFPRQFQKFFASQGIDIEQYTVSLSRNAHLKGLHGSGMAQMAGGWNRVWSEWIRANPGATAKEIFQQAGKMMDTYEINHLPIHPYGQ